MLKPALRYSHELLKEVVERGDVVVDATMGNGNDTAFLATLVGEKGKVYAFDVQEEAVENTKDRLTKENLDDGRVSLILKGHEHLSEFIQEQKIRAAIFNLGYLPKADHSIITKSETTISAIEQLLTKLEKSGRIIIVVYYGHLGGLEEKEAVLDYVQTLNQDEVQVLRYEFINQRNHPPFVLVIEKR